MTSNATQATDKGGKDKKMILGFRTTSGVNYWKRSVSAIWSLFNEFTLTSNIHGVKYLGDRSRHWSERAFWIITFLASIIAFSLMIGHIYYKWELAPSFDEKSTQVWKIPFPVVTICPETRVALRHLNFTDVYHKVRNDDKNDLTADELRKIEALAQICEPSLFRNFTIGSNLVETELVSLLKKITLSINESLSTCQWRNEYGLCSDFFNEIITEEGICYSFNDLNYNEIFKQDVVVTDFKLFNHNVSSTNWTLESGYQTNLLETYPRRILGRGTKAGIKIVLKQSLSNFDYICRLGTQGYKVLLHTPGEIPRISKQYFTVSLNQAVVVSVKPSMITTSEGLAGESATKRQCYFNHERFLQFFKIYTQSNCELECLANFTLAQCNCIQFSMPRDNKTRICTQFEMECYRAAEYDMMTAELGQELESISGNYKRGESICNCLPSCTSIHYDTEISQTVQDYIKVSKALHQDFDTDIVESRLEIFFKESQFVTLKRAELYGFIDFLADFGGLLGLFMGVSMLSLIEIIFYVTLRPACSNAKQRETDRNENLRKCDNCRPCNGFHDKHENGHGETNPDADIVPFNNQNFEM